MRLLPRRFIRQVGLPVRIPVRRPALGPVVSREAAQSRSVDAWLYTGCVMDAWQRPVHNAALRVMAAAGASVAAPLAGGDCCGALHAHAGLHNAAASRAELTMQSMPGHAPIVVDSAGCGAALKDYGTLLGTETAQVFSARVRDLGEWLEAHLDRLPIPAPGDRSAELVAIQDPCHLRHVQRAHMAWRPVLRRFADTVELDDDGRCCGAGGSYSITQPTLAGIVRSAKIDAIARTGAGLVASANPGCSMWLADVPGGPDVRHPIEIIDEVLHGR